MAQKILKMTGMLAVTLSLALPAHAESGSGAYLAGRHAAVNSDYADAARYYSLALARDPGNVELLESASLAHLSLGEIDKALPLARLLGEKNQTSQVAHMVITAALAGKEDFAGLVAQSDNPKGVGPWVDGLVKAWAELGTGDMTAAMARFDALSTEAGMQGFVMYHKALALASVGDYEGAEAIFGTEGAGAAGQTRRGVLAHAEILAQLDRRDDAVLVLRTAFGDSSDPEIDQMIAALESGAEVPYSLARDAKAGIAEVFYTFAAVLKSESAGDYFVVLYARIARYLAPDNVDALLLTADLLENLGQFDLAIEVFKSMPANSPAYHAAELGRADALRRSDRLDQAIEVLQQLSRSHDNLAVVHSTLGDLLRAKENYAGAIAAYDRAIDLAPESNRARWLLFYSRGIARERSGDGAAAEEDFRAALKMEPEQPQVLNYLGYSLVEQNRNLDEALDMIERAVAASPNSGYIVDSLGWVFYRLGRYEEAVDQMERAVELLAVDPVVNDHLGDVYWAVGRQREAEFQWRRALSFIKADDTDTEADPDRIRRKLEVGLDKVLEEEGAPPLKVANEG